MSSDWLLPSYFRCHRSNTNSEGSAWCHGAGLICPNETTTTQMYKLINEYMSKRQINIHADELIHKHTAIFIHNLHSNTFAGPGRSEREKYHYTIIRLPSTFHCPLPNMKYSMYLHLKMSIPFNITA